MFTRRVKLPPKKERQTDSIDTSYLRQHCQFRKKAELHKQFQKITPSEFLSCRIEKERSLNRWSGLARNEFSIWTVIIKSNEFSLVSTCLYARTCRSPRSEKKKKSWQLGERQKFARSSCRGFVAQWSECPTGNRKTQVRSPAGLRCVFFVWSSCQFTFVG